MKVELKDAKGDQLTAPWGRVHIDLDESNAGLLTKEQVEELQPRLQAVVARRLNLDHLEELLAIVEEYLGITS